MKFSLLALTLIPATFAATTQQEEEKNKNIVDAVAKMTNNLLMDTEKFASMNGMLLEDMVSVPGVMVKSTDSNRGDVEKRALLALLPFVTTLAKHVLSGVGEVLTVAGLENAASVVQVVTGFL